MIDPFETLRRERAPSSNVAQQRSRRPDCLKALADPEDIGQTEDWLVNFPQRALVVGRNDLAAGLNTPPNVLPNRLGTAPTEIESYLDEVTLAPAPDTVPPVLREKLPLRGGLYSESDALAVLNDNFVIMETRGGSPIAQIAADGSLTYISQSDFSLRVRNIAVQKSDRLGGFRNIRAEKFWLEHPARHQRRPIFDPKAAPGSGVPGVYNLWHGFAFAPRKGWSKQLRLLRHIFTVLCKRDRANFKYLIKWLAWAIQNPDRPAGTVIVLKSRHQGTGKSTLSYVMRDLFGRHGRVFDNKERLLGKFNADLETVCLACAEEMVWAGDRGAADALKSFITGDTLTIEFKNGPRWDVPNRIHMIMTTNHEHAIQAGVFDRRFFVLDVSHEKAQNSEWFDPLFRDMEDGGREQFLWLLQNLQLKKWHPRQLPKTVDTVAQQRMSSDSVARWIQSCIDDDSIVGDPQNATYHLGTTISSESLRRAYANYCSQQKIFSVPENVFGKALTSMFGPPVRLAATAGTSRRPRAFRIVDADELQVQLDAYLGVTR